MPLQYIIYVLGLVVVFLLGIVALTVSKNKSLEIEVEQLKGRIQIEALKGELNLAKFQIQEGE